MTFLRKLGFLAAAAAMVAVIALLMPVQRAAAAAAAKMQEVLVLNNSSQPIPVQNLDEPGRNPYQEYQFQSCSGQGNCGGTYAVVPTGKRLVIQGVGGYVDVAGGTVPNCFLTSSIGGNQYLSTPLAFTKGTVGNSTRFVINQDIHGYLGAGENPTVFCTLFSTGDNFSGGFQMMITGYYVNQP